MKTAEELVAFNQGNIEAMMKSGQIWATGVQDLSKHIAAAAQASLDESMSAFKALTSVKSLKDAFELQSSFARSALEKSMAESGKLTDASFKLTEQALAPITARVTVAVEKFAKAACVDQRPGGTGRHRIAERVHRMTDADRALLDADACASSESMAN